MEIADQSSNSQNSHDRWDKVGIFLSGLCALHCLLTPLLVLLLPVIGGFFEQPGVHLTLALIVVPVGFYAFWTGFRLHKEALIFGLGLVGLSMVGGAAIVPHEWVEIKGLDIVTIIGSFCLLTAHYLNRRACLCGKH